MENPDLNEDELKALDRVWEKIVAENDSEKSEPCPEYRVEEKFVHYELPPSQFKGRKFILPKEKT